MFETASARAVTGVCSGLSILLSSASVLTFLAFPWFRANKRNTKEPQKLRILLALAQVGLVYGAEYIFKKRFVKFVFFIFFNFTLLAYCLFCGRVWL
jgi:hypothetical protein